jgi:hypothetical protein
MDDFLAPEPVEAEVFYEFPTEFNLTDTVGIYQRTVYNYHNPKKDYYIPPTPLPPPPQKKYVYTILSRCDCQCDDCHHKKHHKNHH